MAYTNHVENDSEDTYILDVVVEEDHMWCKDEVKESFPLKSTMRNPPYLTPVEH